MKEKKKCAVSNVSVSACVICIRIPTKSMWLSCAMDVSKIVFFSSQCMRKYVLEFVLHSLIYLTQWWFFPVLQKNVTVRLASSMCVYVYIGLVRRRFCLNQNCLASLCSYVGWLVCLLCVRVSFVSVCNFFSL